MFTSDLQLCDVKQHDELTINFIKSSITKHATN